MKRTATIALLVVFGGAVGLRADFSYEQSTEMTGGAMQSAMKMAGMFSKKARQPMRNKVVVKGDRMAQVQDDVISITDLKAETITTIHPKKRQYSVVTFEQMRQFLAKMASKAGEGRKGAEQPQIKVSVKDTGNTKTIAGRKAREFDMSMQIESRNPQTGESGAMNMLMKSWMAPVEPGYKEIRDFYRRLAEKLHWAPGGGSGAMMGGGQGMVQGMSQIQEQAGKLDGMPVLQVVRTGYGDLSAPAAGAGQPATDQQQQPKSATGSIAKGLGGLGGFGRFGRKKNKDQAPEQAPAAGQGSTGALMEMTITFSGFSNAAVDPSLVDTQPAGFKLVKSDMEKALR